MEDRCYKSKAVPGYDLFRPKRTAVTILSSFFARRGKRKERFQGGVGERSVISVL